MASATETGASSVQAGEMSVLAEVLPHILADALPGTSGPIVKAAALCASHPWLPDISILCILGGSHAQQVQQVWERPFSCSVAYHNVPMTCL